MSDDIQHACESLAAAALNTKGLSRAKSFGDDRVNPPEAQVLTREYDPRYTFTGNVRPVPLTLRVFVQRQNPEQAQKSLRGFMEQTGPTSIIESLENSDYWPEDTHNVVVVRVSAPFETVTNEATYLAVDFDVDVTM